MAEHLGRVLKRWEIVHHKNRDKQDNRLDNLELVSDAQHALVTHMEREIDRLSQENQKLNYARKNPKS